MLRTGLRANRGSITTASEVLLGERRSNHLPQKGGVYLPPLYLVPIIINLLNQTLRFKSLFSIEVIVSA